MNHKEWGSIVSKVATAHSRPGEKNTVVFELHEGAPLVIKDKKVLGIKSFCLMIKKDGYLRKLSNFIHKIFLIYEYLMRKGLGGFSHEISVKKEN